MNKNKIRLMCGVALLVSAALTLAACAAPGGAPSGNSGSSGSSSSSNNKPRPTRPKPTPRPTVAPIMREVEDAAERTFKYADLDFSVTKATISNQVPNSDPPRYSRNDATLDLTLSVTNPTKDYVFIDAGLLRLKFEGAKEIKEPFNGSVEARDTQEFEFQWEVPITTTWEGAQLILDESDKEPVTLALSGAVEKSQYPVKLTAGAEVSVDKPVKLTYKVLEAMLDLNGQGKRVEVGKRFVLLKVLAQNKDSAYNVYVGPESFRLLVDGVPKAAERLDPAAEAIDPLSEQEFQIVFLIPANAKKIELEVGEAGKSTAKIPIELGSGQGDGAAKATPTP